MSKNNTSWQNVSQWYNQSVGFGGSYFHKHLIIPGVLRLLKLQPNSSILDLACGQGILARYIPKEVYYQGLDLAPLLIKFAQRNDYQKNHYFSVADITKSLPIEKNNFTHAALILALQNISQPELVLKNTSQYLIKKGKLVIVLNHPCFRIPRQSSWEIDAKNKLQYRRINRYLSPLKIPVQTAPSKHRWSTITWSFHYPLSSYSQFLYQNGFVIEKIEEWSSDKESVGNAAKMENRSRQEFPLFMAILAKKTDNSR